jgi:hypothetical protein
MEESEFYHAYVKKRGKIFTPLLETRDKTCTTLMEKSVVKLLPRFFT